MNDDRKVQDDADILRELRQVAPGAHIAGGAVRDTILGRPIKDVDIFLRDFYRDDAATRLRSLGYVKVGEWVEYEGFSDPSVAGVAKFEKADETIPLCLIGLKQELTAKENVARFDYGLCMGFYEGGELITTTEFKRDAETKTFTLSRADNIDQFIYSMARFNKLTAERYKGWTLAVLDRFEDLAREYSFRRDWYMDGAHFGLEREGTQLLHPKAR